jgi:hypothetical protein
MSLTPITKSASELYKALPVPARVIVAIVAVITAIYFWYFLIGAFFITAMCVGTYHIFRWFITR